MGEKEEQNGGGRGGEWHDTKPREKGVKWEEGQQKLHHKIVALWRYI